MRNPGAFARDAAEVVFTTNFYHGFDKPILASRPRYRPAAAVEGASIATSEQAASRPQ
jgi:hypothetical protein